MVALPILQAQPRSGTTIMARLVTSQAVRCPPLKKRSDGEIAYAELNQLVTPKVKEVSYTEEEEEGLLVSARSTTWFRYDPELAA